MLLTNEQWSLIQSLITPAPQAGLRGRPAADQRLILNGILWKLSSGSSWSRIPPVFGSWHTASVYYKRWRKTGLLRRIINLLIRGVRQRGGFDYVQAVRDGTVKFIFQGDRYEIYLPASLSNSWQLATSLLYYRRLAVLMERSQGLTRLTDPLSALYTKKPARVDLQS